MPNKTDRFLARAFVTSLGIGYSPLLPGTLASVGGVLLYLPFHHTPMRYLVLLGSLSILGLWASHLALKTTDETDPTWIVMDEVVGMMVALFLVPPRLPLLVIGFCLFRFFDSIKLFPINRLELLPGEWGIFLDDLGAGIYTCLILHLILVFIS